MSKRTDHKEFEDSLWDGDPLSMEKRGLSNHQGSSNNIASNSMFDRQAAGKNHKI